MRDYAKEYREYQGTPEQIKHRAMRNAARRLIIKKKGKDAVRGKDIDHSDGNPMNNSYNNLKITSVHYNRSKK
jgi:hypothetical protein